MPDYEIQISVNIAELDEAKDLLQIAIGYGRQMQELANQFHEKDYFSPTPFVQVAYEIGQITNELEILNRQLNKAIKDLVIADFNIAQKWEAITFAKYTVLELSKILSIGGLFNESEVKVFRRSSFTGTKPLLLWQLAERIPQQDAQVRIEKYVGNASLNSVSQHSLETQTDGDTYIVYISGTREWGLNSADAFDLTSNISLANNEYAGSLKGAEEAMLSAGVTADDKVILVGYSQGGMVASALAASKKYRISHLITFGSPAIEVRDNSGTKIISIEHKKDMVPKLLGQQPQDGRVLVTGESSENVSAHDLGEYINTAREIDAEHNKEILELQEVLKDLPASAETSTWRVNRVD